MASVKVFMKAGGTHTLHQAHEKIHYITGAEAVFEKKQHFGETEVWLLVYEKYFFRVNSFAALTVLLTEEGGRQTAQIVTSGGGNSMSNVSYGAEKRFAKECVAALTEAGFAVDPEQSDALPKGLLDRFRK